jgi:sterol desaturase/sphingolipid hydroxylase (fatty acid hydroxylase superfamily)
MLQSIETILAAPVAQLVRLNEAFSLYALAGATLTALIWYVPRRRGTLRGRVRAFVRAGFSRRVWLHKSTWLDFKLFFVSNLFNAAGIMSVFAISYAASAWTQGLLSYVMEPAPPAAEASAAIAIVMVVLYWVMYDLGYWFAHWLMHRIPVLWEFHKVHHSAEVLTPLTEWRQHPVELFLFPLCTGTTLGVLFGATEHLLGLQRQGLSLFWVSMVLLAYSMTLLHLRHSHVWIPVRGWLGYVIQSPAHHQIHHSTKPEHFNKNLGYGLSLWDWAFRTLYIPNKHEALEFGLSGESREHTGVFKVLWLPFLKAGHRLRQHFRATSRTGGDDSAINDAGGVTLTSPPRLRFRAIGRARASTARP